MLKFCIAIISLLVSTGLLAATGERPDPESVHAGKKLYVQYCQACHQKDGVGEKPIPAFLAQPGYLTAMPLNETSHAWHHTDEQIIHTIMNGLKRTKRMPAWKGVINEQQAGQILAYLKSLWSDRILGCQGPKHMSCM